MSENISVNKDLSLEIDVVSSIKTKTCYRCNRELEIEKFRVHKSGYTLNKCKECEKEDSKLYRNTTTNEIILKSPKEKKQKHQKVQEQENLKYMVFYMRKK